MCPAEIPLDPRTRWSNRHENFQQTIKGVYLPANPSAAQSPADYNATAQALQTLIRRSAERREHLRAQGSGWSFSKVATTDGFLLNTKQLTIALTIHSAFVSQQYPGRADHLFLFQAGASVWGINEYLRRKRMSLKTSGASDGQTIAGAVSTGTHGAAVEFGAMPDFVVGIHLATGGSRTIWLERKSSPVVAPALPQSLDADLVQDDELFDAALVSFGSFGVVLGLLVEAEDLFLLEAHRIRRSLDARLRDAMIASDFTQLDLPHPGEQPHHFELLVNPHDLGGPTEAQILVMYKRPYRDDYPRPGTDDTGPALGEDALAFFSRVFDLLPLADVMPSVVTKLISERYRPFANQLGTHGEIFSWSSTRGKVASSAMAVPAARSSDALDLLLGVHGREGPFPGAIGVRFVRGTRATLGFTRFPRTCVLEIDGVDGDISRAFYRKAWKALEESDIQHAFHWGKMNGLTPTRTRRIYGDAMDAWLRARARLLPAAASREVFSSPYMESLGLGANAEPETPEA